MNVVRGMKSLKHIGLSWDPEVRSWYEPDEFWPRYDAGEFR
jgi:hypothetical protein